MKNIFQKKFRNSKGGFTIVETLVAIMILVVAITGPMSIASKGLHIANVSKNQVIASYLAQEGVEYIKAIRNNSFLQSREPWLTKLSPCTHTNKCKIDATDIDGGVSSCGGSCGVLNISSDLYTPDNGTPSVFTREIEINEIHSGREAEVISTVKWNDGGEELSVTASEFIYNWYSE